MNPLNDNDIQYAGHPEEAPRPDPLVPQQPQKKPKNPYHIFHVVLAVTGIVAVLALIAIVAVMVFARSSTKKTNTSSTVTTTNSTPASLTAAQTIKDVNVYFKGKGKAKSSITTPVKAKGKSFYTVVPDLDKVVSLAGYVAKDKTDSQLESIEKSMDYDGFTQKVFSDGGTSNYLADYTRSDVTCQLSTDISKRDTLGDWVEIRCLDASVYLEYANAQDPLVSLYTPTTTSAAEYGFIGKPQTKAGAISGYQLVEIPASSVIDQRMTATDNLAMYYQSPDGLWHYFQDHNAGILVMCTQYNTVALRMAYNTQSCQPSGNSKINTVIYKANS